MWYVSSHVHSFHKHFYEVDDARFSDENDAVEKLIQDTGNILWLYYNSATYLSIYWNTKHQCTE